jgi:LacI family transcriptional regulator
MNIYDLAREAGVSIATASKAINGRGDVSERTRAKVLEVAKRLHYHPSHLARGLAQRRTENIGVVVSQRRSAPFSDAPSYSRVVEGMERELTARNYNLLLSMIPNERAESAERLPKLVREKNADGLVLLGGMPQDLVREIIASRIPTVVVGFQVPNLSAHYVLADNRGGEHSLVGHLAALGHRHIAFVRSGTDDYSFAERQTGFEDACTVHKVGGTVWAVPVGGRTLIEDEILRGLQAVDRPSAVLAADDHHALAVLRVAHALGLRVPEDLSVAGFDDLYGSELAGPGLTTLRVDWEGMGLRAVQGIFRMMELSPELSGFEEVPVELVVRGSTGPAGR